MSPWRDMVTVSALMPLLALFVVGQWGCSLVVNLDNLSSHGSPTDAGIGQAGDCPPDGRVDAEIARIDGALSEAPMAGADAQQGTLSDATGGDLMNADVPSDASGDMADEGDPSDQIDAGSPGVVVDGAGADDLRPGTVEDAASGTAADAGADAALMACPHLGSVDTTLQLASIAQAETACGYAGPQLPRFYAAVDPGVFASSAACGTCVIIETPAASVEALVVDLGPTNSSTNPTSIAVSRAALSLLLPDGSTYSTQGVQWLFTPCTLSAPGMTFKIQSGSSATYAAVLIQNYRYRLDKVEYKIGTTYKSLTRASYNYWVAPQGMGGGPFTLRMTDAFGHSVEQSGIPLIAGNVFIGQSQFPPCSP